MQADSGQGYRASDHEGTGLSPARACRSRQLYPPCCADDAVHPALGPQFDRPRGDGGFGLGLSSLPSPVLGASLLVSFPPPTNMLKFGGWASRFEVVFQTRTHHAVASARTSARPNVVVVSRPRLGRPRFASSARGCTARPGTLRPEGTHACAPIARRGKTGRYGRR